MSWYRGDRLQPVLLNLLRIEQAGMPLDCCDESRTHAWLWTIDWQTRRAFLVPGDEFFRVWATSAEGGLEDAAVASLLAGEDWGELARQVARMNVEAYQGCFRAEMEQPAPEAEGGERIEIANLVYETDAEMGRKIAEMMKRMERTS